jgi:hypothetical protein
LFLRDRFFLEHSDGLIRDCGTLNFGLILTASLGTNTAAFFGSLFNGSSLQLKIGII